MSTMTDKAPQLSEREAAVYDRQIRVWGVNAQQRMRKTRVLLLTLRGLGTEIVKNLALAGVGEIVLHDSEPVAVQDLGANFYLTPDKIGRPRGVAALDSFRALNPMIKLQAVATQPSVTEFDIVIQTHHNLADMAELDSECRKAGVKYIGCLSHGYFGLILVDYSTHEYTRVVKRQGDDGSTIEAQKEEKLECPAIKDILARTWSTFPRYKRLPPVLYAFLLVHQYMVSKGKASVTSGDLASLSAFRDETCQAQGLAPSLVPDDLLSNLIAVQGTEMQAICAILGGIVAQEVLKVISGNKAPLSNVLMYDGLTGKGHVEML